MVRELLLLLLYKSCEDETEQGRITIKKDSESLDASFVKVRNSIMALELMLRASQVH